MSLKSRTRRLESQTSERRGIAFTSVYLCALQTDEDVQAEPTVALGPLGNPPHGSSETSEDQCMDPVQASTAKEEAKI